MNLFLSFVVMLGALAVGNARGHYYVDWSTSTCVEDGNHMPWHPTYGSLEACCSTALWWKEDCDDTPWPTRRPTTPRPTRTTASGSRPAPRPSPPTPSSSSKGRVVLGPIADTFIDESRPDKNFGNRSSLHSRASRRGTRESLLRFDLSSVQNKCIKKAKLALYSLTGSEGGGVVATLVPKRSSNSFARAGRWEENQITWNSVKSLARTGAVLKKLGRTEEDSWVSVDVTAEAKTSSQLTILVASEGHSVKYASKEKDGCAPKLQITFC